MYLYEEDAVGHSSNIDKTIRYCDAIDLYAEDSVSPLTRWGQSLRGQTAIEPTIVACCIWSIGGKPHLFGQFYNSIIIVDAAINTLNILQVPLNNSSFAVHKKRTLVKWVSINLLTATKYKLLDCNWLCPCWQSNVGWHYFESLVTLLPLLYPWGHGQWQRGPPDMTPRHDTTDNVTAAVLLITLTKAEVWTALRDTDSGDA